jgi:hypothetical protein
MPPRPPSAALPLERGRWPFLRHPGQKPGLRQCLRGLFFDSPGFSYANLPGAHNCDTGWEARATAITGHRVLSSPADMKTWLATCGPLIACVDFSEDFHFYGGGVYSYAMGISLGKH